MFTAKILRTATGSSVRSSIRAKRNPLSPYVRSDILEMATVKSRGEWSFVAFFSPMEEHASVRDSPRVMRNIAGLPAVSRVTKRRLPQSSFPKSRTIYAPFFVKVVSPSFLKEIHAGFLTSSSSPETTSPEHFTHTGAIFSFTIQKSSSFQCSFMLFNS